MTKDKIRGMVLGVAIGDALGMPLETMKQEEIAGKFGRVTSYIRPDGHKWFNGRGAGTWTDDTQLTLAVAESLIEKKCIDMDDLAARHVKSYQEEGDLGWGKSTREAVRNLEPHGKWWRSGALDFPKAGFGNGVVMKIAPLAVYFADKFETKDPDDRFDKEIIDFTFMTHMKRIAAESAFAQIFAVRHCFYSKPQAFDIGWFAEAVCEGALRAQNKLGFLEGWPLLRTQLIMLGNACCDDSLTKTSIESLIKEYGNSSYVYESLPFSYACFLRNPTSIEALYETVNAGGDTDTNGSIVGALLGALNGTKIFPKHLTDGLWRKDEILDTADRLCEAFEIQN